MIALITEWQDRDGSIQERTTASDLGGTMRLGAQTCYVKDGTLAKAIYGADEISERHRHRYEFNNRYLDQLAERGPGVLGLLARRARRAHRAAATVHPWFFATQFHPEFNSNPRDGHPLFTSFITAARVVPRPEAAASRERMRLAGFEVGLDRPRCS